MTSQATATRTAPQLSMIDAGRRRFWMIACVLLSSAVFAPTVQWLVGRWTVSVWHNGHGMFIPPTMALLIWHILDRERGVAEDGSAWGFLFVLPALALATIDAAIGTQLLSAFAMVLLLPGVSLLVLGARRTRALTVVWVLALFMLPIPAAFVEPVHAALRATTAAAVEQLMHWCDVSVFREGTTLYVQRGSLVIADACDGFSTLYATMALAVLLGRSASWARRMTIAWEALACTVFCNTLRCAALTAAVSAYGGDILETPFHVWSGIVSFTAALGLLLLLVGKKVRREAFA